ncbi:hypothetical protein VTI28DRAFT_3220 [Corynascus sepedonium]
MPRFRSDSDISDDYAPRYHHRSPRRRSLTPGPRPGNRDISPDDAYDRRPRFEYEPHTPFYPPPGPGPAAAGPGPGTRPSRSTDPTTTDTFGTTTTTTPTTDSTVLTRRRGRDRGRDDRHGRPAYSDDDSDYYYDDDNRNRNHRHHRSVDSRSPPRRLGDKARDLLSSNFTPSTSGLGVGVLGAIVGGLAAREASEAVASSSSSSKKGTAHGHGKGKGRERDRNNHQHLISTVVGAAVGGLGANAIEKRLEEGRAVERGVEKEMYSGGGGGGGYRDGGGRYK